MLGRRVMLLINAQNIPYWLDVAVLLNQIRNESTVSLWDHDSNMSIIDSAYFIDSSAQKVEDLQQPNRTIAWKV